MTDRTPSREQADRDAIDDYNVVNDWPDRVGTGPHADHTEELMPS